MTSTRTSRVSSTLARRTSVVAAAALFATATVGCNNAGQGALTGAGIGALGGLAIGSIFGASGTGAAVGALGGAVAGGVIGDQNDRRNRDRYDDEYYHDSDW